MRVERDLRRRRRQLEDGTARSLAVHDLRVITREEQREAQTYAAGQLVAAGIALTNQERAQIEVADFGLGALR